MMKLAATVALAIVFVVPLAGSAADRGFPYVLPKGKPDHRLSAAVEHNDTAYSAPRPEDNELYSQFKYLKFHGLDHNQRDGTITFRYHDGHPRVAEKMLAQQRNLASFHQKT